MNLSILLKAFQNIKWRELSLSVGYCPLCKTRRVFIRLNNTELGIRCLYCRASVVTLSLVSVLQNKISNFYKLDIYELSARGPLVKFLSRQAGELTCSEYLHDVEPGIRKDGILCQDVQKLTFADASFDVCTSTEVFEHVPDDIAGFSEIHRVLKPGGIFIFTVPIFNNSTTIQRVNSNSSGKLEHILPPQYHGDPIRGHAPVLVYRDYGLDLPAILQSCGFNKAEIITPSNLLPWRKSRPVVYAVK